MQSVRVGNPEGGWMAQQESIRPDFTRILTDVDDILWTFDPTTFNFTWFSPNIERLTGFTQSDVMAKSIDEMCTPESASFALNELQHDLYRAPTRQIAEQGARLVQLELLCADGSTLKTETLVSFHRDENGVVQEVMGISRPSHFGGDLRADLAAVEERFRQFFRLSIVGLVILDKEGNLMQWNEKFQQLLGYDKEELATMSFKELTHPDDVARDAERFHQLGEGPTDSFETVKRCVAKSGDVIWVRGGFRAIMDEGGELDLVYAVIDDITDLKETEEALEASQEQLIQAQKMEAVGRLAGGVAHDFNNLLSVIISNSELMMLDRGEDSLVNEGLREIIKASKQAASLTSQLLAFGRKQVTRIETVDQNDIILRLTKMVSRLIGPEITIHLDVDEDIGAMLADRGQVEQVLMNLAVNARDALPKGGRITIKTRAYTLDDEVHAAAKEVKPGDFIAISVSDNGIGMEPEVTAKIFEPFFTTKELGKGTGLGLSTVYGIIKQNNGFVHVESKVGFGTTMTVYFPKSSEQPEITTYIPPTEDELLSGSGNILCVEDDDALLSIAERTLTRAGYSVMTASMGWEGLAKGLEVNGGIDLLFTDILMPGMNGSEMAEKLSKSHPNLKVLYTSGYPRGELLEEGKMNDEVDFLPKPWTPTQLLTKVAELMKR